MKGHIEVIDYLKMLLKGELAARDQYFIHSRLYEDWGFNKLYERINHCGFHAIRPPSPRLSGRAFHAHPAICSTAIRPGSRSAATQVLHC
ncbi:Bacterioferritin [compost metagenome]